MASPLPNMIGPQVSGPLGGASFLSVDEMTSGIDRAAKIADQQQKLFKQSYELGNTVQAGQEAKLKKDEIAEIQRAEFNAVQQLQKPQEQAPVAPTQSAAPVVQPTQSVVPAATPPVVAPVAPAGPAPTVGGGPSNMAAPTATPPATVQPEATPPVVQPAAQAPAPVATSGAPVLPQAAPQKSFMDRITGESMINGTVNRLATPVNDARKQLVAGLVEQGKIRPETAQEYIATIDAAREKGIKEAVELEGKIAEIKNKDMDTREKGVKIKVAMREANDNSAFAVLETLRSGKDGQPDIENATLVAQELGVPFDGSPKAIKQLEIQAKRSPDFKAATKEERENAKEVRDAAAVTERTADKDTGYFFDKQGRAFDADGNRVSSAQIQAAQARMKQAGRAVTNIGRGTGTPDSGMGANGELRGLSRDKQGNWTLSKDVQTNLAKSRPAAEAAANAAPIMKQLRAAVETGKGSESKIGSMAAAAGEYLPDVMKPEITQANQRINNAANALIGLLNDPRLKGNPTKQEAEAVMKIIADPQVANSVKLDRIAALEARFAADMEDHNAAVAQYDEPTRERLKATGLNEVGDRGPKAPAPKQSAPQAAVDAVRRDPALRAQFKAKYGFLPE